MREKPLNLNVTFYQSPIPVRTSIKHTVPVKIPLSFRRCTSLNSLAAEDLHNAPNAVDTNSVSGNHHAGNVADAVGKFEGLIKKDVTSHDYQIEHLPVPYNGYNSLQKSISTPSVTQIFGSAHNGTHDLRGRVPQNQRVPAINVSALAQPPSSKRSFFRRKHKANKAAAIHAHPPVVVQHFRNNRMNDMYHYTASSKDEENKDNYGKLALSDPSLALQEPDAECWTMFMGKESISQLDEKEIKRQEHMSVNRPRYELILTEKHHCLTLALMHSLFVTGMKNAGYSREAKLLFPGLTELLKVHFTFLTRMRERQLDFRSRAEPMPSIADLILEQFSGDQWQAMVKLYGLLCSSHKTSLDLFKNLQKESKFAALVSVWNKEQLLARKNVPECLLLVAQRITKYPLLFEPLIKKAPSDQERREVTKALKASRELNEKVNERVAQRECLLELFQKFDSKSTIQVGSKWLRHKDLTSLPSRRLLFKGQAYVSRAIVSNGYGQSGSTPVSSRNLACTVAILTDYLVFLQEVSGKYQFVPAPTLPGVVMLDNLIVRHNATDSSSLFLLLGTGTAKAEMIELQVIEPQNHDKWVDTIRDAKAKWEQEGEILSDVDEDGVLSPDPSDFSDAKTARVLEVADCDRQISNLLKSRTKLVDTLKAERPLLWSENNFEGKDDVINAIALASTEVQKAISHIEQDTLSVVNRSTSCVSEHVSQALLAGLPKRADTFSGFDSHQRLSMDLSQLQTQKLMYQMVVQLTETCGDLFQQMLPQLTPQLNQSQNHLQRRMEELREAQQRLETEKAEWQKGLAHQQEEMEKKQNEMKAKANALQEQEKDISQQREQLYRKLEALQKQGIRPNLDAVSPSSISISTNNDRPTIANLPPRRPPNPNAAASIVPAATNNSMKIGRQQIPHFLANSSAVKSSGALSPGAECQKPTPVPRTTSTGQLKISSENILSNNDINNIRASQGKGHRVSIPGNNPQQILPFRISETQTLKTTSLPRGVGSRSSSSVMERPRHPDPPPPYGSNMRSSASTTHVLQHSNTVPTNMFSADHQLPGYVYHNGPANDRMSSYHKNATVDSRNSNGYTDYPFSNNSYNTSTVSIVHRRSGSSPVPMSTDQTNAAAHLRNLEDDFDSSKVLFL